MNGCIANRWFFREIFPEVIFSGVYLPNRQVSFLKNHSKKLRKKAKKDIPKSNPFTWDTIQPIDFIQKVTNTKLWKKSVEINKKVEDFGKWLYDIDKEKELKWYDRALLRVDLVGDAIGGAAFTAYVSAPETFGVGAAGGFALDILGAVFDAPSAIAHVFKGDWKMAGWKGLSILPFVGSAVPVLRVGSKVAKLTEVAEKTKLAEKYAPFAQDVYRHFSDMKVATKLSKEIKAFSDFELRKMGMSEKSIEALRDAKGKFYHNTNTNENILAFTGTRPDTVGHFLVDLKDDILSAIGFKIGNYRRLDKIVEEAQEIFQKFTTTGHSKGNVPATIVSEITGLKNIGFNSAGVSNRLVKKFIKKKPQYLNNIQINLHGDGLSYLQDNTTILKYLIPSAKGTRFITGSPTLLEQPTFTLGALLGKLINTGLKKHGIKNFIIK